MILDATMCDFIQKEILLEKCVYVIAMLSKKEQTPDVCFAEDALAQLHRDLLVRDEKDIDYDNTLDKIYTYYDIK